MLVPSGSGSPTDWHGSPAQYCIDCGFERMRMPSRWSVHSWDRLVFPRHHLCDMVPELGLPQLLVALTLHV